MPQCARMTEVGMKMNKKVDRKERKSSYCYNLVHPITIENTTTKLHANFFDESKKVGILTSSCEHGINLFQ